MRQWMENKTRWHSLGQSLLVDYEPIEKSEWSLVLEVETCTNINKQEFCMNVIWLNRLRVGGLKKKKGLTSDWKQAQ